MPRTAISTPMQSRITTDQAGAPTPIAASANIAGRAPRSAPSAADAPGSGDDADFRRIRVEVDDSDDRMQKKIRNAQQQKVPFMVLAGDQDIADGTVSFRYRDGRQENGVPLAEAPPRV